MKRFELTPSQSRIMVGVKNKTMGNCWVVGGAVRDIILRRDPHDIDFATNLLPDAVENLVTELGFIRIPDQTAKDHGIIRVVDKHSGDIIDIATLRKDDSCDGRHASVSFTQDLKEDLARRDLTINAMAAEIDEAGYINQIIDPFGGQRDLEAKVINFVGCAEERCKEDWLRIIRACRFCALDTGWQRSRNTNTALWTYGEHANEISRERIRDELLKAMSYPNPGGFIRALDNVNLLRHVIPSVAAGVDVGQNEYHDETIYEHCVASLDAAAGLTDSPLLRLAALLHDVGKCITRSVATDGRVHFYRHEVEGASIAYKWLLATRFAKKEAEYISKLIRHHQWRFEKDSKDKTIRRWLQEVGKDTWRDLITLRCADRRGNFAKRDKPMMTRHMQNLVNKAERIIEESQALFREDLAISGHDLKELGVPPGPLFKEIFSNMLGIVIADPSRNDRTWLIGYVRKNYVEDKLNERA